MSSSVCSTVSIVELAAGGVQQRQRDRRLLAAVDDLADHIRALVAEEQARQHLDLEVGARLHVAQPALQFGHHVGGVALEILERQLQIEVAHQLHPGLAPGLQRRVIDAVGGRRERFVDLDVGGGDRRPDEDEAVVEVAAVQDLRRHRVEEGLGQLGLPVVDQQADVEQLDLLPDLRRQHLGVELDLQAAPGFAHALVVERDALAHRALLAMPVGALEALLGGAVGLAEQPVMAVEAVEQRAGYSERSGCRRWRAGLASARIRLGSFFKQFHHDTSRSPANRRRRRHRHCRAGPRAARLPRAARAGGCHHRVAQCRRPRPQRPHRHRAAQRPRDGDVFSGLCLVPPPARR